MKPTHLVLPVMLFLAMMLVRGEPLCAQEQSKQFIPDKALCARMLQFGKEAYVRGKYLDAKEYFRKAVQADPTSQTAWRYYDLSVVFALAEKVEQRSDLVLPGVSQRVEGAPAPGPPPPAKGTAPKKSEFKIIEDEGC